MAHDVPHGALTMEAVVEWLPDRRLDMSYIPALLDQDVERIQINLGNLTSDDEGEMITTLYVGDADHEVIHAVGYELEDGWTGIHTWIGDEWDAEEAEAIVVEWLEAAYPDSSFSKT